MIEPLIEACQIVCPYCSHSFETTVDCSVEEQEYYEDCQACCAPILFEVSCSYEGQLLSLVCKTDSE